MADCPQEAKKKEPKIKEVGAGRADKWWECSSERVWREMVSGVGTDEF